MFTKSFNNDVNNCNFYVAIMAEVQSADNVSDVTFPDPTIDFNTNNSIFIPASYIQERSMTTGKLYFMPHVIISYRLYMYVCILQVLIMLLLAICMYVSYRY